MTQPFQHWNALRHGKLSQIDNIILTVVGEFHMPVMDLARRMTLARLQDSRLVIFRAIALNSMKARWLRWIRMARSHT